MQYRSLNAEIVRTKERSASPVVSFVASTANPDRYGDVINQRGWSLAKYRKNPVILLNHNANQLPIGRGEVDVIDGQLMVDIEFDMAIPLPQRSHAKPRKDLWVPYRLGLIRLSLHRDPCYQKTIPIMDSAASILSAPNFWKYLSLPYPQTERPWLQNQ